MTEIVKVSPTDFGLTEETAQTITKGLAQILSEREVLAVQYNEVITLDINDPKTAKKAKDLRVLVRNNRTKGIETWHKANKEFYLRGGQFVDAIKRKEVVENERMEEALEQIEKHQELLEKKRIADLQALRQTMIAEYIENSDKMDLGNMQNDVWEAFYAAKKKEFEDRKEAERLAEIEREKEIERQETIRTNREALLPFSQWIENFSSIDFETVDLVEVLSAAKKAKEKDEAEKEAQRIENERLKKEAEEREAKAEAERKEAQRLLDIEKEKLAKEKAERDRILEEERKAAQAEADRVAKENQVKLDAAEAERKRIEKELQDKKDAEAKAEQARLAEEEKARKEAEKLAKAPIKEQLTKWVNNFEIALPPIANETTLEIAKKFNAFQAWAKTQVENI